MYYQSLAFQLSQLSIAKIVSFYLKLSTFPKTLKTKHYLHYIIYKSKKKEFCNLR